jgi:hypothetical protein
MDEKPAILKPLRWLAHLPLVILPFLAAAIDGPRMQRDVERRVAAALVASGHGWAKVAVDGQDAEIRGVAPSRAAVDSARRIAAATAGVRRVDMRVGTALP